MVERQRRTVDVGDSTGGGGEKGRRGWRSWGSLDKIACWRRGAQGAGVRCFGQGGRRNLGGEECGAEADWKYKMGLCYDFVL